MERLAQRSAKYFYMILIITMLFHLADSIISIFRSGCKVEVFILMLLSSINLMILCNSLKFNIKQQFTECKVNAKILRFTMALSLILHTIYVWNSLELITLRDDIMTLAVIELVLTYRINCIEYLEKIANRFAKENMTNKKGG